MGYFFFSWTSDAVLAAFDYVVHTELSEGHYLISSYIYFICML